MDEENKKNYIKIPEGSFILDAKLGVQEHNAIVFLHAYSENQEILKLCQNGDIYVKGKLVENDKEVVDALRELLKLGLIK